MSAPTGSDRPGGDRLAEDAAAMALHALRGEEAEAFRRTVAGDPEAAAEYARHLDTVARLADLDARTPPPSLRAAVFDRLADTPQEPPATGSPVSPVPPVTPPTELAGRRRRPDPETPWFRRRGVWLSAAAAAVVIAGGTALGVVLSGSDHPDNQVAALTSCVVSATDATELEPSSGGGMQVTVSRSCGGAVLDITRFQALPDGKQYQLWALSEDEPPRSLGVLGPASRGVTQQQTVELQPDEGTVAVSVEPDGGSAQPSDEIVFTAPVPG
ncbi:anti-sigma factor [Nakamurella leprariae]|uniref:Regulator of SigK n=1 Tax=Nakamurella leprariae TaxID=2803911 RepID=A0A938YEE6_9ACTN|nr:anti-sigma factor [Nakamurella leprariae]MBM9466664.1 anti-sigma factor [Nakamurella leprariae]